MKVLLKEDVDNLGYAGEVMDVADGYGRNYLIPQGFAVKATPGVLKQSQSWRDRAAVRMAELQSEHQALALRIVDTNLEFTARAGETGKLYGSVTTADIVEQLNGKLGTDIDRRSVVSDPLRQLGEHKVTIRLSRDFSPQVPVYVHQFIEEDEDIEELEVDELEVDELEVDELEVDELEVDELEVDELEVDELEVDELEVDELEVDELEVDELEVDELEVDELEVDELEVDELEVDELEVDELEIDEMEIDEIEIEVTIEEVDLPDSDDMEEIETQEEVEEPAAESEEIIEEIVAIEEEV